MKSRILERVKFDRTPCPSVIRTDHKPVIRLPGQTSSSSTRENSAWFTVMRAQKAWERRSRQPLAPAFASRGRTQWARALNNRRPLTSFMGAVIGGIISEMDDLQNARTQPGFTRSASGTHRAFFPGCCNFDSTFRPTLFISIMAATFRVTMTTNGGNSHLGGKLECS